MHVAAASAQGTMCRADMSAYAASAIPRGKRVGKWRPMPSLPPASPTCRARPDPAVCQASRGVAAWDSRGKALRRLGRDVSAFAQHDPPHRAGRDTLDAAAEFDASGHPAAAVMAQPAQDIDQPHVPPWRMRFVHQPRRAAALALDAQAPARESRGGVPLTVPNMHRIAPVFSAPAPFRTTKRAPGRLPMSAPGSTAPLIAAATAIASATPLERRANYSRIAMRARVAPRLQVTQQRPAGDRPHAGNYPPPAILPLSPTRFDLAGWHSAAMIS